MEGGAGTIVHPPAPKVPISMRYLVPTLGHVSHVPPSMQVLGTLTLVEDGAALNLVHDRKETTNS